MLYLDLLPLNTFPYIMGVVLAVIIIVLLYIFKLKPSIMYPLPNEEDLGVWKIPLASLGRLNDGRVTTARNTIQAWWGQLITNSAESEKKGNISLRDNMMKNHLFAQRCEGKKILYLFDKDPLSAEFNMREDTGGSLNSGTVIRWINQVQDCISLGSFQGFETIGVKLGAETVKFSDDERNDYTLQLDALKHLKLAAHSKEEIKNLHERVDMLTGKCAEYLAKINETIAGKAKADLIAGTKPLVGEEAAPKTFGHLPAMKEFFTTLQVAVALSIYFLVPNIMRYLNIYTPEPSTMAVVLAIVGFILTPFARKWLGK